MHKRKGKSYLKRAVEVQAIYEYWSKIGLSNRDIWRRHVYPRFCICERTFNNIISRQVEEAELPSSALPYPEYNLPLWQQNPTSHK